LSTKMAAKLKIEKGEMKFIKLSSTVGAIFVEGPNRRTHFWTRTIQWLFHQNFVLIEQMVSHKKICMGISHRVLCSLVEWSLYSLLPKLCPVIPIVNQDGRQAKNRKRGDEIH
jgi:hypothetical protein